MKEVALLEKLIFTWSILLTFFLCIILAKLIKKNKKKSLDSLMLKELEI